VLIKEMQSLALDVKVLGDVGEEIAIRESVDDDVAGLEVNIEGAEMDAVPEKRSAKPRDDDFSDLSFEELDVPDIDGLDDIDIDIDKDMMGPGAASGDDDDFEDDFDTDFSGDDEDLDSDGAEKDDYGKDDYEKGDYYGDDSSSRGNKYRDDYDDIELESLDGLIDDDDKLFSDDDDFDK
jgi:hypothetical protein